MVEVGIGEEPLDVHYHFLNEDGGLFQLVDNLRFHSNTLAPGWTVVNDGAGTQINRGFHRLFTTDGGLANNDCLMYIPIVDAKINLIRNNQTRAWRMNFIFGQTVTQNAWFRLTNSIADPPIDTAVHVGWKIIDNVIYATSGDGVNSNVISTSLNTGTSRRTLTILFNTLWCKFYNGSTFLATITTYLPPHNTALSYHFQLRGTAAAVKTLKIEDSIILSKSEL